MSSKILDKFEDEYRGVEYTVKAVFISLDENPYSIYTEYRDVKVNPDPNHLSFIRMREPLDPKSVFPWRDPQPNAKEEQIERAVSKLEADVDRHKEMLERARQD